jgi:hypothetical protein
MIVGVGIIILLVWAGIYVLNMFQDALKMDVIQIMRIHVIHTNHQVAQAGMIAKVGVVNL